MFFQTHVIGCVWKTPFRKSSHILTYLSPVKVIIACKFNQVSTRVKARAKTIKLNLTFLIHVKTV